MGSRLAARWSSERGQCIFTAEKDEEDAPCLGSYDVMRFAALELMFEPCKGCVAACFGAC